MSESTAKPNLKYEFITMPATGDKWLKISNSDTKKIISRYELPSEWKTLSDNELKTKMREYNWEGTDYGSTKTYVIKSKKVKKSEE